jgi:hypothetical protein
MRLGVKLGDASHSRPKKLVAATADSIIADAAAARRRVAQQRLDSLTTLLVRYLTQNRIEVDDDRT